MYTNQGLLIDNCRDLIRVYFDAVSGDNKAQVLGSGNVKFALLQINLQACVPQPLKDLFDVEFMLQRVFGVYKDVVQISSAEVV